MKLISIQIVGFSKGWSSNKLIFGDHVTQLFGANGCGKTPIVQSIVYCLGYPCIFRQDIYENCNYVTLEVEINNILLKIKRTYDRKSFYIEITENENIQTFYREEDFSYYLFQRLDISIESLISKGKTATHAYFSTILPLFYVDQDKGYADIYFSPNNFIQDQFSEMVRLLLKIPPKNAYDKKEAQIKAKEDLDYLDREVQNILRLLETVKRNSSYIVKSNDEIINDIVSLEKEIDLLKTDGANKEEPINAIDRLIVKYKNDLIYLSSEIEAIRRRKHNFNQIIQEINIEIETLTLNEEAKRVFLSINEICGSGNCQLFASSSEAYTKNLLYLKDQIKDLENNFIKDNQQINQLEGQETQLKEIIKNLELEKESTIGKNDISSIVGTVSEFKQKLFKLQQQKAELEKIEIIEKQYIAAINDRDYALTTYESFGSSLSSPPELIKARMNLKAYLISWLDTLDTKNVSKDITFKSDFDPVFGNETVAQIKGSTKARVILAYHAALLQLFAEQENNKINFLVLDTPKQHETHNDDIDCYFKALKELCIATGVQVIFSTTEYHYEIDENDKEWIPQYHNGEQNMFLCKNKIEVLKD